MRLSGDFKEDTLIWLQFLRHFNGKSICQFDFISSEAFCLFTDAAGSVVFFWLFGRRTGVLLLGLRNRLCKVFA